MRDENGKLKKGSVLNPKGRPKGSKNKATKGLRDFVGDFLAENIDTLQADFDMLEPKERIDVVIKLMEFSLPKLSRMQSVPEASDVSAMTDEEIRAEIEMYKRYNEEE